MQVWKDENLRLCEGGEPCDGNIRTIEIGDDIHTIRSQRAEEVSQECREKYPLPVEARNGGQERANPRTMAFRDLTTSVPSYLFA